MLDLLLVDDEKSVLEAMANTIRWENYGVRLVGTCGNAIEALHFMETSHLDVIITDVKMPVVDGIEMIKRAKEMGIKAEFVILSGFSEFEFAQRAMSLGVRHYLLKPCGEKELGEALMKVQQDCAERLKAIPSSNPETAAPQKKPQRHRRNSISWKKLSST